MPSAAPDEDYTPEEAQRRAREVAHRLLNTPPQPRMKAGKPVKRGRARVAKSGKRGQAASGS